MTINESDQLGQEPSDPPTLGQLLQSTRQLRQLSAQTLADRLYLKLAVIDDIESDRIDPSINPLFSKGYISNYAKQVGLEPKLALQLFEQQYQNSGDEKQMQSFSQRTKAQLHNRYLNWVTLLIMAGFVAMIVSWWWQQNDAAITEQGAAGVELSDQSSANPEITPNISLSAEQLDNIVPSLSAVFQGEQDVVSLSPNAGADETGKTIIGLSFSQDCWINITDASNEVLAIGMKKAGSMINVSGIAPFQVTLGAPTAVNITYRGTALDISPYIIDNAARFSVPLEQ